MNVINLICVICIFFLGLISNEGLILTFSNKTNEIIITQEDLYYSGVELDLEFEITNNSDQYYTLYGLDFGVYGMPKYHIKNFEKIGLSGFYLAIFDKKGKIYEQDNYLHRSYYLDPTEEPDSIKNEFRELSEIMDSVRSIKTNDNDIGASVMLEPGRFLKKKMKYNLQYYLLKPGEYRIYVYFGTGRNRLKLIKGSTKNTFIGLIKSTNSIKLTVDLPPVLWTHHKVVIFKT